MTTTTIFVGNCKETLSYLPDQSVHTCVTSPPYFGLRDYGMSDQIGLEDTPESFVAELVDVFREVRRVLRDDGTLWLNLGDSYANGGRKTRAPDDKLPQRENRFRPNDGMKPKDLIGIPWRVAFALQADGWYLRQDIIWHKPNPMPESVTDRCTRSHEYIFLLSKSPKYYFDGASIKEPLARPNEATRKTPGKFGGANKHVEAGKQSRLHSGNEYVGTSDGKRNRRDVWTVSSKPYKGAHFATFPPDLIEPCVLAGCPVGGIVLDPFGGSGTTGMVANQHGRDAWLCELNPQYAQLALERIGPGANLST